jgi:glucosyl-3-phosphoglycerate synthase
MDIIDEKNLEVVRKVGEEEISEDFTRALEPPDYIRDWIAKNTFHHSSFRDTRKLVDMKREKGLRISLCFPTLNEEKTIGLEVELMRRELVEKFSLLDEIVVIDSGSTDGTERVSREAGADFYRSEDILPTYRAYKGKGENLWKSLYVLKGDIICWIDADITNIHPRFVRGLIGPLLTHPHLSYVKAFYKRPIRIMGELHFTGGGRVTELVVRPFFNLLFPELTGLAQPLSGEYAGRRTLLERLPFFTGYGVESGHLIDILRLFSIDIIGQCDLDVRIHRNQNIESLRSMSYRILKILLQRADDMGRIEIFHDIADSLQVLTGVKNDYSIEKMKVWGIERPPMITVPEYREAFGIAEKEARDGTVEDVEKLPYTASLMFHKDLVIPRLLSGSGVELVGEMVSVAGDRVHDHGAAAEKLRESGRIVETPIGRNIVFYHAFGEFVDDIVPIIGISEEGIPMTSPKAAIVHIAFTLLAPEYLDKIYSKIIDSMSRIFSRMEHFEWLLRCRTPEEIIAFISYLEAKNKIMKMLNIEDEEDVYL